MHTHPCRQNFVLAIETVLHSSLVGISSSQLMHSQLMAVDKYKYVICIFLSSRRKGGATVLSWHKNWHKCDEVCQPWARGSSKVGRAEEQ